MRLKKTSVQIATSTNAPRAMRLDRFAVDRFI
jgi:hypothetical protein